MDKEDNISTVSAVFKYKANIESLNPQCPPKECLNKEIEAYRYTFNEIKNPENFKPAVLKNPGRFNDKSDLMKCSGYGLSMYDDEQRAISSYEELSKTIKKIKQSIGSHLAKGVIGKIDGVCGEINGKGHFDFHEYENISLSTKFSIIKEL
jgi:hypothetical protein